MKYVYLSLLGLMAFPCHGAFLSEAEAQYTLEKYDAALSERTKPDVINGLFYIYSVDGASNANARDKSRHKYAYKAYRVTDSKINTDESFSISQETNAPEFATENDAQSLMPLPMNYLGFLSLRCQKTACVPSSSTLFDITTKALHEQQLQNLLAARTIILEDEIQQKVLSNFISDRLAKYYDWRAQSIFAPESAKDPIMLFLRGAYEECGKNFNPNAITYYIRAAKMGYPLAQKRIDSVDSSLCKGK